MHPRSLSRIFSGGALALTCLLALPSEAQAKGPKKQKDKSEHSNGNKNGHYKNKGHDDDHNEDSRRVYISRPRSTFTLSFGNGYRGQGYYYGPPNSPYYYERPDVNYYSNREAAPREYYENPGNSGRSNGASVQQALAQRGYYDGSIDGQIGPQSSRAIARYQRDQGLQETGSVNSSLLQSLGLQ